MKLRHILWIGATVFVLAACQITPTFTTGYKPSTTGIQNIPHATRTLVVRPFTENRPGRVYSTAGKIFLTYIPFIPYIAMPYERIEESIQIQSDHIQAGGRGITLGAKQNVAPEYDLYYYPNSFARAIAEDLAQTGAFKEVKYSADPSTKGDLELTGAVNATPINKACTSYLLGLPGVLLWFLPIPMAKTSAAIDVDLTLKETASGRILWQGKLDERIKRYITLYTSSAMVYGRSGAFSFNLETPPRKSQVDRHSLFSWHFEALRRSMDTVKPQLIGALDQ